MQTTPGMPKIVIVRAENRFTGTTISYPSTIIWAMYNNANEHANLNHKNANFSKITPKPIFPPIKIPKKSSTQTTPIIMYVVKLYLLPITMYS